VAAAMVQYPSADRCFELQFAAPFSVQPASGSSVSCPGLAREQPRRVTSAVPDSAHSGLPGNPMNMMAPTPVWPGCAWVASGCPENRRRGDDWQSHG
jgi:hypothetical protein